MIQQMTTNHNEWQRMTTGGHFGWFSSISVKKGAYY